MDNRNEIDDAIKGINSAVSKADKAREVDDILNEILGSDGSYKADFSEMFTKYNGSASPDLTDIMPSAGLRRRDYSAEADEAMKAEKAIDSRISKKVPSQVRKTYDRETETAVRPEFTPDGSVRYPSYGVGESEQRVVFDADWEDQAKEEAKRIEKLRRSNMLRGDSQYARDFQFTRAQKYASSRTPYPELIDPLEEDLDPGTREVYSADGGASSRFIDPLSGQSDDRESEDKQKKSFFREGFSVKQKTDDAVSGKTQNEDDSEGENGGLSPEVAQEVDSRVIEAFASDIKADNEYRDEHWQEIVDKARVRKQQMEAQARQEEARARSLSKLNEQKRKIAQMEGDLGKAPITNMDDFTANIEDKFEAINPEDEEETIKADEETSYPRPEKKAGSYRPDLRFDSPAGMAVEAEMLTPEEVKSISGMSGENDKKIKKSASEKFAFFFKTHFSKEGFKRFAVNNLPQKGDSTGEKVRKTVRTVSFVVLVCAVIYLLIYYHNYRERVKFLRDSEIDISSYDNIPDYELDDAWAEMRAKYPDVDFPEGMNIKFANLYAISSDVVGWLKIDNTEISTVLLQTNNDSYYLYRDIYGNSSRYGNPYVKASCSMGKEGLSKNTVIYGHNTHDKLIFNKLESYMTVQGYLNAPIITLDTLYEQTKWKIFAVMLTNADPADDNGHIFTYLYSSFSSENAFLNKMAEIKARSMIHTGVDVQAGDKTLMLYTCYRSRFSSGRLVIVARQLREGESEDINTSLVYYDSSAIFPAAYYGKSAETTTAQDETENTTSAQETTTTAPAGETQTDEPVTEGGGEPSESVSDENAVPVNNDQPENTDAGESDAPSQEQPAENTSENTAEPSEEASADENAG